MPMVRCVLKSRWKTNSYQTGCRLLQLGKPIVHGGFKVRNPITSCGRRLFSVLCFNHSPSCGYLVSAFGVLLSVFTVRLGMFVRRVSVYGVPSSVFGVCVSDVGCWMVFDVWLMGSVVALGCSFAGNRGSRMQ